MRPAILIALAFAVVAAPRSSTAQCSANASSCVSCHETQGLRPVLGDAQPWHVDHGFGDLCSACHGGAPGEEDQTRAHRGRREPLIAIEDACAGCHRDDAAARAAGYQAALAARPPEAPSPPPPRAPRVAGTSRPADPYLAALALALALALVVAVRRPRLAAAGPALAAAVRAPTWSPYAAGALLGAIVGTAAVALGRPLAASSAVDKLAAYLGRWWFADAPYYRYQMAPGITWQVWLVIGVLGGAFASARWSGQARWRWLPDAQWGPRFGPSRGRRLVVAFLGAVLVQVGAGIAGGCTSGLAISGGAVLAPAAFLFMAGMFAGGIPTAWLWYRRAP
ncbi:MAG: YeeE/YedE family protein [Kofleriaceae bacterium]|nr:YeeE/YedE family protein [Kofleriaceae bacterium]MBP9170933.1 YeeE/YedE family protein [Kofleriaceae bacterium]MBP9860499.1 YeeE/YedE family protein [Kofleriaceae bacterium]